MSWGTAGNIRGLKCVAPGRIVGYGLQPRIRSVRIFAEYSNTVFTYNAFILPEYVRGYGRLITIDCPEKPVMLHQPWRPVISIFDSVQITDRYLPEILQWIV
jgi:hypothetical protein